MAIRLPKRVSTIFLLENPLTFFLFLNLRYQLSVLLLLNVCVHKFTKCIGETYFLQIFSCFLVKFKNKTIKFLNILTYVQ